MKDNLPSLTAACVGLISSLRWHSGNSTGVTQAKLMKNLSISHMPIFFWIFVRVSLCHVGCTKIVLAIGNAIFGKNNTMGIFGRKSYMKKQVIDFIETNNNAKELNVIILAAGYDILAMTIAKKYPHVTFIELDHPATGEAKLFALKKLFKQDESVLPRNLYFCHDAIGENCTIKDALIKNGIKIHDKNIPTAIIMEGLSFYLTEAENREIFQELGELFGCKGSIIAFDFFNLDENGRPINPNINQTSGLVLSLAKNVVKLMGEPFKWGIAPDELENFFTDTGWVLIPSQDAFESCGENHPEFATTMGLEYEATLKWAK